MLEPASLSAPALPRAYDVPLLRLRLRLALLTMAILPTTLAMALVYSTLNGQAVSDSLRLQDRTVAAVHVVDSQLERAMAAVTLIASDPGLSAGLADPNVAREHAGALVARPFAGLRRFTLFGADGAVAFSMVMGRPSAAPGSGRPARNPTAPTLSVGDLHVATTGAADRVIHIAAPLAPTAAGAPTGALGVEIALSELLDVAAASADTTAGLYLVDGTAGELLGAREFETGGAPAPTAQQVVATALAQPADTDQWAVTDDWRTAAHPLRGEFGAWRLMIVDRVAQPQLPLALLGLLAALTVLLVAMTVWMARQVIGPAQELAHSREQLLAMYETARADALRDALTGLGNHRGFQEELDDQLEWHKRYKVPFALLLIDLDDLKLINDTRGHSAGDEAMRTLGRLIGEITRYADRAFRIGGDEFAILMPHTDADGALELGRRLLARAMAEPAGAVPFSGGVSSCPALATTRDELYAQADAALYWCKRHGRASLDVFDPVRDRGPDSAAAGSESTHIARVIASGQLRAVYQPVVDLRSGVVIGFEGLTRPLPESGFSNPGQLFAAAESAGRIVELDYACLETVVEQAHGLGPEQLLSINLSPRTVEAPQFSAEWLVGALARHRMDPRRVIIELTEQQDIEDLPQVQRNLIALQRAGIRVAVDDVGAGNAGLRLLSQFRFDIVKIDLSLVQDGTLRDSSRAVLTSLRELAGRWGAYVVAEGIETVSQLRVVRELRLSAGQGYLLGRPMAAPTIARVDLASIDAGGVVMQVRHDGPADMPLAAPRPATN